MTDFDNDREDAPITFTETVINKWIDEAESIFAKAAVRAAQAKVDPLFEATDDRLYRSYREAHTVLISHGHLIERALVHFVGHMQGWSSRHEAPINGISAFKADCLAFDHRTGRLIVFECKRGLRGLDRARAEACERRLGEIRTALGSSGTYKFLGDDWEYDSVETLIVSYYGARWSSGVRVLSGGEVDRVFGRNLRRALHDFVRMTETRTKQAYRLVRDGEAEDLFDARRRIGSGLPAEGSADLAHNTFGERNRAIVIENGEARAVSNDQALERQAFADAWREASDADRRARRREPFLWDLKPGGE